MERHLYAGLPRPSRADSCRGESSYTHWTHRGNALGQYSVPEGTCGGASVEWSLTNNNDRYFAIDDEGSLTLADAASTPAGTYDIDVVATINPQRRTSYDVSVDVKKNIRGTVTLQTGDPPRIGTPIVATFNDRDNPRRVGWRWQEITMEGRPGDYVDGEITNTFTPDDDRYLNRKYRATVTYNDDAHPVAKVRLREQINES